MVAAVRRGHWVRAVARRFNVSPPTVQRWVDRAKKLRLDRADFADKPSAPRTVANRIDEDMEQKVLLARKHLKEESDLGQFGAEAIHLYLTSQGLDSVPSVRTINRILLRRGALDSHRRVGYPSPAKGWYLAELAQKKEEMDQFDFVEGLVIAGVGEVEIFNTISLHSGIVGSWIARSWNAKSALEATLIHWRRHGLPNYAQYDNDTRFQGPHQHPGTIGRIIKMCLGLGVTPVFAPPRESGFQAAIENYNGRWQQSVWLRFKHASVEELTTRSEKYVEASLSRHAQRIESAPERREFPEQWGFDEKAGVKGKKIFLRRTDGQGRAKVLGGSFEVSKTWLHRLVRCEVRIEEESLRFYQLRRKEPSSQPLLREVDYKLPRRYLED